METTKCKFCDGNVQITEGSEYGVCDLCESTVKIEQKLEKSIEKSKDTIGKKFDYDLDNNLFHWTSFPLLDKPKHTIATFLVIIIVTWLLWEITINAWEQPLYYMLGIFMLFVGIIPYFVPTQYYFFDKGIVVIYPIVKIEKLYSDFGCFYADKNGIMLSTFSRPRRLDSFRGQSIRFSRDKNEREEIIEFLKDKVGKRY